GSDWNDGSVSPTRTPEPAFISDTRPSEKNAEWPDGPAGASRGH
ncbi:MAG: hypothetical protein QOI86_3925, partial [Actinomycetota bacterium]|nr:hypothetical protein [Actinomycetota bacterium]